MRLSLLCAALSVAALSLASSAHADEPPGAPPAGAPLPAYAPPAGAPLSAPQPGGEPAVMGAEHEHDEPPPVWGLHSGDTVAEGNTLVYGEVGWPDLSLGFARGVRDWMDVGLRISMIYSPYYVIPNAQRVTNDRAFGFGFTIPLRFTLHRSDRVSVMVHADPGARFDWLDAEPRNKSPYAAPQLPVGIDLGVHLSPRTTFTFGVEVPMAFQVSPDPAILIPILPGVAVERRFTDHFGMSINVHPGVLWGANRTGSASDIALLTQLAFFGRI